MCCLIILLHLQHLQYLLLTMPSVSDGQVGIGSASSYVFQSKLLPAPHHQQLYYLTLGRAEQEIEIFLARGFIYTGYVHVHH